MDLHCVRIIFLLLGLLVCFGCDTAKDRVVVTGNVTFDGVPVEDGLIKFKPMPETQGNLTMAFIKNGTFAVEGTGGVPFGNHRVEIFSFGVGHTAAGERTQLLPTKYNSQSELTAEVTAQTTNLDFQLDSK
jgi:hypothetical protein